MDKRLFFIEKYIAENFQNEITVEHLAEQAGLSNGHFTKLFKKDFKTSPMKYVKNTRLEKACEMLKSAKHLHINEIGEAVGFKNPTHFIREFSKTYGSPPRKYETHIWDEKTDKAEKAEG